jgi:Tol biopolymer transport system component
MVPPTSGILEIATTTTGPEPDADGYSAQVDTGPPRAIARTATLTVTDVTPGDHTIQLGEIAANCTVSGDNPQTVTVTAGDTTTVGFSVTCIPTTGKLRITAATSGPSPDPDGYAVAIDGTAGGALGANEAITISLPTGGHAVVLTGVAENCSVVEGLSRDISVTGGATTDVTFAVTCVPTTEIQVTTITTGSAVDPDGYEVTLDGAAAQAIGSNATLALEGPALGTHNLALSGVASNCHIEGGDTRTVEVVPGSTVVTFDLTCLGADALIAFTSNSFDLLAVFTIRPDGSGLRNLTPDNEFESNPVWSPDGRRLLFTNDVDLYVMNADGSGRAKLVDGDLGIFDHHWSPDGRMIAYVDLRETQEDVIADLWVVGADGTGKIRVDARASDPSWAPDARRIVYATADDGDPRLRIINADGTGEVPLTTRAAFEPAWSPDGTQIAFVTPGGKDIFLINPDGTGEVNLTRGRGEDDGPTWSPDGSKLAFSTGTSDDEEESEIAIMGRDGSNRQILTNHRGFDFEAVWSPEGSKIVFTGSEREDTEIYVMNADGSNQTNLTRRPNSSESTPDWNGQGQVMVAGRQSSFYLRWLRGHDRY